MKDINKVSLHFKDDTIQKGIENNLISFNDDNTRIFYNVKSKKNYNYKDPEEKVRAYVFVKLILDYGYNTEDIDFEVIVPRRTPEDLADIVVYEKGNYKQPYLVVECKKDGISDSQFEQAIEQVFGNANSLRAKYAWAVAGNTQTAFDIENFDSMEREKNVISDIPVSYGKTPKFRFKKEKKSSKESKSSLKVVSREELIKTLEKCHDTVWQGGKLNPSDAFDEVSKILFCKLLDEKKTKVDEFYKFQVGTHETNSNVAVRIRNLYEDGKEQDPNVFSEDIKLGDDIIYKTVEHLQSININKTDLDSKGVAFERFMGDFFKGKMGQYFTPRNIVDFCVKMLFIKQNEKVIDPACGSGGFLLHAMDLIRKEAEENYDDEKDIYSYWHDFASRNLFGIEINEQIARVCKMNMIIHDDGHTNVISADSLNDIENHAKLNSQFRKGNFDIILTNPPFGAKVLLNEKKYLKDYELGLNNGKERAAQSTEVLFIERCFEYLKEGGRMAIVLPDGILTNSTLQYVRDFIMENFIINAIVSIPQTAFSHYGAGVKCSLLFLTKSTSDKKDYDIFMAQAEYVGYDATGREIERNDLNEILENYKLFAEKKNFKLSDKCFLVKFNNIKNNRIDPFYIKFKLSLLENNSYKSEILENILYLERGITYSKGSERDNGLAVLRAGNITLETNQINFDDIKYLDNNLKFPEEKKLKKNDIFICTNSGSKAHIGKVAFIPNDMDYYFGGFMGVLRVKDTKKYNPYYIFIIFTTSYIRNLIKLLIANTTINNLNFSDIAEIPIPILPIEIQKYIANIMQKAYLKKKEFEEKANEYLYLINNYILDTVKININENKKKNTFIVNSNQLKGKRIDAFWYSLGNMFYKSKKFENQKLSYLVNIQKGETITNDTKEEGDIPVIAGGKIPAYYNNKSNYNGNVITISASGSAGYVWWHDSPIWASDCNVLTEKSSEVNIKYIYYILKFNQENIYKLQRGSVQPHVYASDLSEIPIPIPPIEIQNKIVKEIEKMNNEAIKYQNMAKTFLENAKIEVEKIIFK